LLAGPAALAATGLALGAGLGLGLFARRRLGGLTGDVYGAIIELGEVFVLAGFAAWEGLR
ncbi:MAG: adenosylcobinamide-GDP ribazoletransferase, partial [Chloroflexota bacterium]